MLSVMGEGGGKGGKEGGGKKGEGGREEVERAGGILLAKKLCTKLEALHFPELYVLT